MPSKPYLKLNTGDPDVEAPKYAIEAVQDAIKKGGDWTHYGGSEIPKQFREAVVDYYKKWIGPVYKESQVIPVAGSSAALYIAMAAVLKEGDEIILWEPSYSNHYIMLRDMGIKMKIPELSRESGYHMDLDKLSSYVTKKTKAVLVCNPNNPTGSVYTKKEIEAVGDLAEDHDLAIFSDEIYLHYVYDDNKFVAPSTIGNLRERTINIMSFSKTFSMTGWRLGYVIVPDKYLAKAQTVAKVTAPRPATFIYPAGVACLRGDFKYVEERRKEYQARRDYFTKAIDDMGMPCHKYEGAFYAWFDARRYGFKSEDFVARLEKAENLALSNGAAFGTKQDGFIRVPMTAPIPVLKDAVERVERFTKTL
jgi:aminotransferase